MTTKYSLCVLFFCLTVTTSAFCQNNPEMEADPYTGSKRCLLCHRSHRDSFANHGHSQILRPLPDGQKPANVKIELPAGLTWQQITHLVGAKDYVRFLDQTGYVVTGNDAQWSFFGQRLTPFKKDIPRGKLAYTCIKCHSVGWKESGTYQKGVKNDLPGIPGVWFENSVGCEACHGAGYEHYKLNNKKTLKKEGQDLKIKIDTSISLCGSCHNRNQDLSLNIVAGDLIQSRQQYTELMRSVKGKKEMTCLSCHDPHHSSSSSAGFVKSCTDCHSEIKMKIESMSNVACIDCHMPFAVRGAYDITIKNYHRGDSRSHLFSINTDPNYALTEMAKKKQTDTDEVTRLTVEMACYSCHQSGEANDIELQKLISTSADIH